MPDDTLNRDELLLLEDWKMAKSKIEFFDDTIMRTRVQGLPIFSAIQAFGFLTSNNIFQIGNTAYPLGVYVMIGGLVYLTAILCLDILHYLLLVKARNRAIAIESTPAFKGKLMVTHVLSSRGLTILHSLGGYAIYFAFYLVTILVLTNPLGT
jgi:hypothetical protein